MISQDIVWEWRVFMMAIIWGFCLLWGYDGIRLLRLFITRTKIVQIVEEIIFWIVVSFLIVVLLGRYNDGAVRNYVVCGILIGMCLYRGWISPIFMNVCCKIIRVIRTFMNRIGKGLKFIKNRGRIDFRRIVRRKIGRKNDGEGE